MINYISCDLTVGEYNAVQRYRSTIREQSAIQVKADLREFEDLRLEFNLSRVAAREAESDGISLIEESDGYLAFPEYYESTDSDSEMLSDYPDLDFDDSGLEVEMNDFYPIGE
jgi:hypothetical protein